MKYQVFKLFLSSTILAGLTAVNGHSCDVNEERENPAKRQKTSHLTELSFEIWREIFTSLDKKSLSSCRQVSRAFATRVKDTQNYLNNLLTLKLRMSENFYSYLSHNPSYALRHIEISFEIDPKKLKNINLPQHCPLSHLLSLKIEKKDINSPGINEIAKYLPNLISLNINNNYIGRSDIGDSIIEAIATHLTNLTSLVISYNEISNSDIKAIAPHLTNLTSLDIEGNDISASGAIASVPYLTNLTSLNIEGNEIGDSGVTSIATHLTNLTSLNIRDNKFGDADAKALAQLPALKSLIFM